MVTETLFAEHIDKQIRNGDPHTNFIRHPGACQDRQKNHAAAFLNSVYPQYHHDRKNEKFYPHTHLVTQLR